MNNISICWYMVIFNVNVINKCRLYIYVKEYLCLILDISSYWLLVLISNGYIVSFSEKIFLYNSLIIF